MIDINTYRRRIGCYNPSRKRAKHCVSKPDDLNFCIKGGTVRLKSGYLMYVDNLFMCIGENVGLKLGYLFYIYYILLFVFLASEILLGITIGSSFGVLPSFLSNSRNYGLTNISLIHTRLAYFVLISYIFNKILRGRCPMSKSENVTPCRIFFGNHTTRLRQLAANLLFFIMLLTFLMIAIVNTSLLNPGPENLKVYYQNVQGLIPFSNLSNPHPVLDRTKICELNTYIHTDRPDVVILNETWLKKSIGDHEIIENTQYKVFRKDRSILSHPSDPNNPRKFKKFGGGVLIAIRSDLNATSKRISMRNGAEIVAIEVTIGGSKFIFCTCYRVGTLGHNNYDSISNSICSFYKSKKPKKIFIVGDFNLSSATWPLDDSPCKAATTV